MPPGTTEKEGASPSSTLLLGAGWGSGSEPRPPFQAGGKAELTSGPGMGRRIIKMPEVRR